VYLRHVLLRAGFEIFCIVVQTQHQVVEALREDKLKLGKQSIINWRVSCALAMAPQNPLVTPTQHSLYYMTQLLQFPEPSICISEAHTIFGTSLSTQL